MKTSLTIAIIIVFSFVLSAQEMTISGKVISAEDGLPLPGVNVMIKSTIHGVQTDFDGKYKITALKGDVLQFSFIGMVTTEIQIVDQRVINVTLESDFTALDEVVVMGYANTTQKQSLSAITTKITSEANGVLVSRQSGNNPNNQIIIRGSTAMKNSEDPLYIIDGVPVRRKHLDELKLLKPNQIKDIKILKEKEASSLYGNRAINGCIIITTTSGNYQFDNSESYAEIEENQFERTSLSPLSTFSIDVDKAAYSNIRRMLNNGQEVPADAVRIEEMINYFNYDYPQPINQHPFSINTEAIETPWNAETNLVKIGLQGKTYEQDELPPSNLTFLIDVSGSMNNTNKLPLLKSAFKLLIGQLREEDKVSIVVYAGAAGVVLKPTSGFKKGKILEALNKLQAGGSTAGGAGIELAYKLAEKNFRTNGNNRVILATDGDFNVGRSSDKAMEKLIEKKRETGIFLSVLGFGYGNLKDSKLEKLANKGNGNHAYIDTMQEAQKVFGQEFGGTLHTIAKDVKIQVEFNPNYVEAYRLIGYENRMLADEDFIDDTIDAGELGSGHTVTAIYEVIPKGSKSKYLKNVGELKYTDTKTMGNNDELFTVKFRYKKPDENKSIEMVHVQKNLISSASSDFSFISAVALFGMQLRKSQFNSNAPLAKIIELAKTGRGQDKNGYKAEFIRLVESYQGS